MVAIGALLMALLVPGSVGATEPPVFPDVPSTHPFFTEISWLAGEGITTGFPDGLFHGDSPVSRQAMAAFLFRYSNTGVPDAPGCTADVFTDVQISHPFCGEIAWLADTGITTGFPNGTFRPTEPVSRQAMSAFLYRLTQKKSPTAPPCATPAFTDVAVAHPFCGEIAWLADTEITTGYEDGSFRPGAAVARQAMAAFLFRLGDIGPEVNEVADEVVVADQADVVPTDLDPEGTSTLTYTGADPVGVGDVLVTMTDTGPFYGRVSDVNGDELTTARPPSWMSSRNSTSNFPSISKPAKPTCKAPETCPSPSNRLHPRPHQASPVSARRRAAAALKGRSQLT